MTANTASPRRGRERGTVLLMFPAAIMIMLVLGAIVLDVGLSQVRARELQAVADSAANDTLAALDVAALRSGMPLTLDPMRARRVVAEAIAAGPLPKSVIEAVAIGRNGSGQITVDVRLSLRVDLLIAPALPGNIRSTLITRTGHIVVLE